MSSVGAGARTVRVRAFVPRVGLGARFRTTMDGAAKSLRQAECMVSACNITLSSICVCARECV